MHLLQSIPHHNSCFSHAFMVFHAESNCTVKSNAVVSKQEAGRRWQSLTEAEKEPWEMKLQHNA